MDLLLAQAGADPSLGGWYVGFGIGALVVVIVVLVVGSILHSANRIAEQAEMATEALRTAHENTLPLWEVAAINRATGGILEATRTARHTLGG